MEQELLRRGQKVVLETKKGERVWRHTFVIDHASPELLFLTPLTEGEVVSVYEVGDKVVCYIPTPVRAYQFESVVVQNRLDTVHISSLSAQNNFALSSAAGSSESESSTRSSYCQSPTKTKRL